MKVKNKELKTLKKLFNETKEKNKITERFSYRFDSRSGRLILSYYIPTIVRENGVVKTLNKKVERYSKDINEKNYKKYFKGRTSIVIDDSKFVRDEIDKAYEKNNVGDEHDFRWWVESFLNRKFGQTKTIKPILYLTNTTNHLPCLTISIMDSNGLKNITSINMK